MAIKPYPFRPRVSEQDVIEWMGAHKARGQLRSALVEAIRLHIALQEGRLPELVRERYGISMTPPQVGLDPGALREILLSLVPDLADEIRKRLVSTLTVAVKDAPGSAVDEEAETLRANFADSRMFDDEE